MSGYEDAKVRLYQQMITKILRSKNYFVTDQQNFISEQNVNIFLQHIYNNSLFFVQKALHSKDNELSNAQQIVKKAYEAARLATEGITPKDEEFKARFQIKFKELPNSLDELQTSMERVKAKIDCMGEGRLNVSCALYILQFYLSLNTYILG